MGTIILSLGILNLLLILFQLSSGLRWINVPFGLHRKTGIALLVSGLMHATFAFLVS